MTYPNGDNPWAVEYRRQHQPTVPIPSQPAVPGYGGYPPVAPPPPTGYGPQHQPRRSGGHGWLIAILVIVLLATVGGIAYLLVSNGGSSAPKDGTAASPVTVALGDPGPGKCFPGDELLTQLREKNIPGEDFQAPYDDSEKAIMAKDEESWVQGHYNEPCVQALAKKFDVQPKNFARYMKTHWVLHEVGPGGLTVLNTYFGQGGTIVPWQVQTFPRGEPVWFTKSGEPVDKFVCGNYLMRPSTPPAVAAPPSKTPSTPTHSCTKCGPSTTPPGTPPPSKRPSCKGSECHTTPPTTPPSTCVPSPCHTCGSTPCVSKSSATQTKAAPPSQGGSTWTEDPPSNGPTAPATTAGPIPTATSGNPGGSTANPIVSGPPPTDDGGTHTDPVPTPTGGASGVG